MGEQCANCPIPHHLPLLLYTTSEALEPASRNDYMALRTEVGKQGGVKGGGCKQSCGGRRALSELSRGTEFRE